MQVRFFVSPQAGIPQAFVLDITDLGLQLPLAYTCHLYKYADGRANGTRFALYRFHHHVMLT